MRFIQASIALGLFSWLSYMVYTDGFLQGDGGSSKTRALRNIVTQATDAYGVETTALGLLCAGILLSFALIAFGARD